MKYTVLKIWLFHAELVIAMLWIFYNFGQKIVGKFNKLNRKALPVECFTAHFLQCSGTTVEQQIYFQGGWQVLTVSSKHFRYLLKMSLFPKIPSYLANGETTCALTFWW